MRTKITYQDAEIIRQISIRARAFLAQCGRDVEEREITAKLSLAHLLCPMRLDELLEAPPLHFAHDIGGILGKLKVDHQTSVIYFDDFWHPRYALIRAFA